MGDGECRKKVKTRKREGTAAPPPPPATPQTFSHLSPPPRGRGSSEHGPPRRSPLPVPCDRRGRAPRGRAGPGVGRHRAPLCQALGVAAAGSRPGPQHMAGLAARRALLWDFDAGLGLSMGGQRALCALSIPRQARAEARRHRHHGRACAGFPVAITPGSVSW